MRILFFIFLVFTFSTVAQTLAIQKTFDDGIENARLGKFEQASANFQKILLLTEIEKPSNEFLARVHFNLGICFYHLNQAKKSVAELTEAIKLSRRNYQKAFYALGMANVKLKNFDGAETAFRDALKLKKSDGEVWFDLAFVYLEKENFDDAERAFEHSIKYKSRAALDAFNNLGVIYALRNDFASAENQFEKALFESRGNSVEAKNNLQFCKFYKQNQDKKLLAKLEFSPKFTGGN
jgi:Flp pilus assembly protein TadD